MSGAVDPSNVMQVGRQYTFVFQTGIIGPGSNQAAAYLATDDRFGSVIGTQGFGSSQIGLTFVWVDDGTTNVTISVADAAQDAVNTINQNETIYEQNVTFVNAQYGLVNQDVLSTPGSGGGTPSATAAIAFGGLGMLVVVVVAAYFFIASGGLEVVRSLMKGGQS